MNRTIVYRLITDLLLALSILQGWWFIAIPLGIIGVWRFPYFVEAIAAGIAYDSLFGLLPRLGVWGYLGTIVSIIIFIIVTGLKSLVRK